MISGKFITACCLVPALVVGVVLAGSSGQPGTRAEEPPPPAEPAAKAAQEDQKPAAVDPDLEKIGTEWKVKHIETDGKALLTDDQLKTSRVVFKDQTAEVKGFDILGSNKFSFKLDSTKAPKEIDVKLLEGPQKEEVFQGIYLVRKDEMRICLRLEGKQFGRPKGYVTTSGTTLYTFILERADAKPAKPPVPVIRPKEAAPAKPEPAAGPAEPTARLDVSMNDSLDGGGIISSADRGDGTRVLHGIQIKFGAEKKMLEYAVFNRGALESRTQFYPNGKTFRFQRRENNGGGYIVVSTPDDTKLIAQNVIVDGGVDIGPIKTQDTICFCRMKDDKPFEGQLLAWEPIPNGYGSRLMMQEYWTGEKVKAEPFDIAKLDLPDDQTENHQWPWKPYHPAS